MAQINFNEAHVDEVRQKFESDYFKLPDKNPNLILLSEWMKYLMEELKFLDKDIFEEVSSVLPKFFTTYQTEALTDESVLSELKKAIEPILDKWHTSIDDIKNNKIPSLQARIDKLKQEIQSNNSSSSSSDNSSTDSSTNDSSTSDNSDTNNSSDSSSANSSNSSSSN